LNASPSTRNRTAAENVEFFSPHSSGLLSAIEAVPNRNVSDLRRDRARQLSKGCSKRLGLAIAPAAARN